MQRRTQSFSNMTKEELLQYVLQQNTNNPNNNNQNTNNLNSQAILKQNKLQAIQFLLAQLNFNNPFNLNLENRSITSLNNLETLINNSVNQQSHLVLTPEELSEANNFICGLVIQTLNGEGQ